jgi:ATP-dependent helicase IRC3
MTKELRKKIKWQMLEKCQDKRCPRCKMSYSMEWGSPFFPTIDHVKALARGGTDTPDNFQLLCKRCNEIKGDK